MRAGSPVLRSWRGSQRFWSTGNSLIRGIYDAHEIEADVRAGTWRDARGIWRALNLELWFQDQSA